MKRNVFILAVCLVSFSLVSIGNVNAQDNDFDWETLVEKTNWKTYSENLVMAMKSGNLGLQTSAMQLIIQWNDKLNVENAATDLVRLYRNNKNERVRIMALVTINTIDNEWAKGIVRRDVAFETSPTIKRMMYAVLMIQPKKKFAVVK
jgi:hypothetical protein